tara:strand:- start:9702 stop:10718 length:1017 start_codon:yes stop_codon:yes gene_type:complete
MKRVANYFQEMIVQLFRIYHKLRLDKREPVILTYPIYANETEARVFGRVIEEIRYGEFERIKSRINHFIHVLKLLLTVKYARAKIDCYSGDQHNQLMTNEQGYFYGVVPYQAGQNVYYQLENIKKLKFSTPEATKFTADVYKPNEKTQKIIISDIDDTVLKSRAANFLYVAALTLFSPTHKRETFPEAAHAYQSLEKGANGQENNMFFYVSSSTWNIFPLIESFLKINSFPRGPILMQDMASERKKQHQVEHGHKLDRICEIAEFYPELPLILIGDAGQKDADIYLRIAEKYPKRIDKILIRKSWWTETIHNLDHYLQRAKKLGVQLVYFESLEELEY